MSCGSCKEVKLLEHAMKIAEKVREANTYTDQFEQMQFGFLSRKGTMGAIFIARRNKTGKVVYVFCCHGKEIR